MPFEGAQRLTRRRSSAGPVPPRRPLGDLSEGLSSRQGPRPTFLTLRDHGKIYVADLPNLSDGQLAHIMKEADEVLSSLERRLEELETETNDRAAESDTFIKASTKRDVTLRFIRAINEEQEHRRNNPALKSAASESLPRTFLEVARHRLPGATFDSLLREALTACSQDDQTTDEDEEKSSKSTVNVIEPLEIPSNKIETARKKSKQPTSSESSVPVILSTEIEK